MAKELEGASRYEAELSLLKRNVRLLGRRKILRTRGPNENSHCGVNASGRGSGFGTKASAGDRYATARVGITGIWTHQTPAKLSQRGECARALEKTPRPKRMNPRQLIGAPAGFEPEPTDYETV